MSIMNKARQAKIANKMGPSAPTVGCEYRNVGVFVGCECRNVGV